MPASYRQTLKESKLAFVLFVLGGLSVVGTSWFLGYGRPPQLIFGIPSWVLFGVFLPWVIFTAIHTWYSLVFMKDDDEEQVPPPGEDAVS